MTVTRHDAFLVHVSSSESREIHAFVLDARTGVLAPLEAIDVPGIGSPTRGNIPMTWDPARRMLRAQVRVAPFPLSTFALDASTGRLRLVESIAFPAPMTYLSTTRDGRFLMGASYDDAVLTVHRIGTDGRIGECLQTISTPPKPHCIVESPFGPFVYATTVVGDAILAYRRDASTGRLDAVATVPTRAGSGPRHLAFHPARPALYCVNERAGSLAAYDVDRSTGALRETLHEPLVASDFEGPAMGADVHVTPDGAFVYASVRKTDAITAFRVDPQTGAMTRVGAFDAEAAPRGFAIDPSGRFLLCAGQRSDRVAVHAIDPDTGALRRVSTQVAGRRPSWIEIVPMPGDPG